MFMQIGILLHIVEENNTKVNSHIETDNYVNGKNEYLVQEYYLTQKDNANNDTVTVLNMRLQIISLRNILCITPLKQQLHVSHRQLSLSNMHYKNR